MDTVIDKKKQSLGEIIYIVALVFGISGSLLLGTMFSWAPHAIYLIRIGIVLCLVKSIFIDKYTPKQFWCYIICLGSAILSYDRFRHEVFLMIPFIFAAKDVDFKKILRVYFWTVLLLMLMVNTLTLIGKIPNLTFFRDGKTRVSYGFTYPTLEAAHIFYFVLAYAVYKKFKLNWVQDVIIALLGYFIITKGGARLDGYMTFAVLFVAIFRKLIFKLLSKLNNFIPAILTLTVIIGFLILSHNYNVMNPVEFQLNNFLSNRLNLTQQGLLKYPVKLFGQHVQMQSFAGYAGLAMTQTSWLAKDYFYIDNSFAQILLINGLVLFVIVLLVFFYDSWKFMKEGQFLFVIVLIFLSIAGSIESYVLQFSYNIFAVMVLANLQYWERDKGGKKKNEKDGHNINSK